MIGAGVDRAAYPDAARCYLPDGRGLAWNPRLPHGFRAAIDAELLSQRIPPSIVRRAGLADPVEPEDFWRRWTQAEVLAKLLDVPILMWVRQHRLRPPADLGGAVVQVRTTVRDDVVITLGLRTDAS